LTKDEDGVRGIRSPTLHPRPKRRVAMVKISRRPIYLKLNKGFYADSYRSDGSKIISIINAEGAEVARIIIKRGKLSRIINYRREDWGEVIESR